jgi:16S rRNA processing protein RimM
VRADAYDPDSLLVGVVGRPHGVRGELALHPYNEGGDALDGAESLILEREGKRTTYAVEWLRPGTRGLIAKLAGVDDRDAAAALTLSAVRLLRAALPPLEPGEFYVEEVVGCAVVGEDGAPLGNATSVFWNGAQDVMTVVDETTGRERLIPLVPDFTLAVDIPGRKIQVRWEDEDEAAKDEADDDDGDDDDGG